MKQILLLVGVVAISSYAGATDYRFMKFNFTDATSLTLSVDGLTVTPDGADVVITNAAAETHRIPAVSLASMEFTDDASGVSEISAIGEGGVDVFSLAGKAMGSFSSASEAVSALAPGVYLVRDKEGKTRKILVEK